MLAVLNVVSLVLVATAMALSLAHALELPGKRRLKREQYLAVQRIYYPGFSYGGVSEPLAVLALGLLLVLTPSGTVSFWLIGAALACAALTHLLYWVLTAPVNKVWLQDEALSSGASRFFGIARDGSHEHARHEPREQGAGGDVSSARDWEALRDRWERSHLYRAATAAAAFVLVATAVAI